MNFLWGTFFFLVLKKSNIYCQAEPSGAHWRTHVIERPSPVTYLVQHVRRVHGSGLWLPRCQRRVAVYCASAYTVLLTNHRCWTPALRVRGWKHSSGCNDGLKALRPHRILSASHSIKESSALCWQPKLCSTVVEGNGGFLNCSGMRNFNDMISCHSREGSQNLQVKEASLAKVSILYSSFSKVLGSLVFQMQ